MNHDIIQRYLSSFPKTIVFLSGTVTLLLLSSCAPMQEGQAAKPDYQHTKEIVLDILQTEDGKKAIQEAVVEEEQIRDEIIINEPAVRRAIQETLLADENKEQFQQLMLDPEFAKEYAEFIEEEQKRLIKDLMNDPQYRESMMEILQDPEMEEHLLEVMESKQYRQQTMDVMKEAMGSPYFRLELLQLLSQVAEDMETQEDGGQEGDDEGDEGDEGEDIGGEGGGEGN